MYSPTDISNGLYDEEFPVLGDNSQKTPHEANRKRKANSRRIPSGDKRGFNIVIKSFPLDNEDSEERGYQNYEKGSYYNSNFCQEHKKEIFIDESKKCYGHFRCHFCNRPWESAVSWVGYWQECSKCRTHVYPYCLHALESSGGPNDPNKQHETTKCQKCKELGRKCG